MFNLIGIVLICGAPGVGKTTFKKNFISMLNRSDQSIHAISISFDEIIKNLIEIEIVERNEWKSVRLYIRQLISVLIKYLKLKEKVDITKYYQELNTDLSHSFEIKQNFLNCINLQLEFDDKTTFLLIIDDIFYYESMRLIYYRLALESDMAYLCICLKSTNLQFLYERNKQRASNDKLPLTVIQNIFNKFDYPDKIVWEKDFFQIFNIQEKQIEINENLLNEILKHLDNFNSNLPNIKLKYVKEEIVNNAPKNLVHESDLVLRKLTSQILQTNSKLDKKEKSKFANELLTKAKHELLSKIKLESPRDLNEALLNQSLSEFESILHNMFENVLSKHKN